MTTMLGDYRLIATLGRGGMAEVFLAVRHGHGGFTKLVVIKRLRADLYMSPDGPHYRQLLLDEANLAARLHHPNIVQTHEVHDDAGAPYLVMEYLDGQPLTQVVTAALRAGLRVPVRLALHVVAEVLAGLEHAHALCDYDGAPLAVVHRDVSPHNVFWTYAGDVKLMDFGVARSALGASLTVAGTVKGKLGYMAPEQARGEALDHRADLFAAGIVLWELLAGRRFLRAIERRDRVVGVDDHRDAVERDDVLDRRPPRIAEPGGAQPRGLVVGDRPRRQADVAPPGG